MVGKLTSMSVLSASRVPAVMGFSPWATANDELAKTVDWFRGATVEDSLDNPEAAEWGNDLEPLILQRAAQRLGVDQFDLILSPPMAFDHPKLPLSCSLDGIVHGARGHVINHNPEAGVYVMNAAGTVDLADGRLILEAKLTASPPEAEPALHRGPLQLQAQMACLGAHFGAVAVLYRGVELRIFVYERDPEMVATIEGLAVDFVARARAIAEGKGDHWYPPSSTADAAKLWPNPDDEAPSVILPPEAGQMINDYLTAKRTIEVGERIVEDVSTGIMEMLGNHVSGIARDADGKVWHVKWPTRTMKPQPEKVTPAKPGGTIRLKTLQIKEARS